MLFEEVLIIQDGELALKEEAEVLRNKTCSVSGTVQEVEAFIKDKDLIGKKQLAGMMTAYIYGDVKQAKLAGLAVEGVPIQELMIHLTENKRGA